MDSELESLRTPTPDPVGTSFRQEQHHKPHGQVETQALDMVADSGAASTATETITVATTDKSV
eukprot:4904056-Alexandrium_andersonii.AAC.1